MTHNQRQRLAFVEHWAEYVRTHSDKEWSKQQNMIINACICSASLTKEQFLALKQKKRTQITK